MIEEPVQYVEIDLDMCTLSWGTGSCTAALSANTPNKCRNTWKTCGIPLADRDSVYDKGVLTLRFIKPRAKMPVDGRTFFPTLTGVSGFSTTVNISGFKKGLGTLGRRGTVKVSLDDFPYNDNYTDKYAAERLTGDAQLNSVGYDPFERSTFWTKLRNWSPNYGNRPIRIVDTHIYLLGDGTPVWSGEEKVRHFIITDIKQDYTNKKVTVEGKDILSLAEKESAVAPKISSGSLSADIDEVDTSFTLTPSGIGNAEYPSSGVLVVSSEVMRFTRSGDTITITERGAGNTEQKSHNLGDTVQIAKEFSNATIAEVVDYLLGETEIPSSFIPSADYADEVSRWAASLSVDTILTKPEAVTTYLGELSTLGASLWWDDIDQLIKLRMNHPLDYTETAVPISDDGSIKAISVEDKDEERVTQVHFYSVQTDPTKSVTDKGNYDRISVIYDGNVQNENYYGTTRSKEIFCRWFNSGNEAAVKTIGTRFLQRFNSAPKYHTITVDKKDGEAKLTDVLRVTSAFTVDINGAPSTKNLQVIGKTETHQGHEVQYTAQSYEFESCSSFIMENDADDYGSASESEKVNGCYIVDGSTLVFPDGRFTYQIL